MPTQIFKSTDGNSVFVIHEPGNATRYVGAAFKIEDGPVGFKGSWAVSFPHSSGGGSSILVDEGMHLHWGYVRSKVARHPLLRDACVSEMTKMIAMMVPQTTAVGCTDDRDA